MQRKAMKQLGKVTQWTQEKKVFSGEKTQLSSEFQEFEREVDVKRVGIERLHATSMPFFENITKLKTSADPNAGKDKVLLTEALGLVMIDYGGDLKDAFGDALAKYGRTRCKMAIAQEEFGGRLRENYIAGMERSIDAVNEYKTFRKKLDSRRLALDSAISKLNSSKKEKDQRGLELEVEMARERFDEVSEETTGRMEVIQGEQEQQFGELADLLEAELEYFAKCKDLLEELRDSWPSGSAAASSSNRPRAKSNASARSAGRAKSRPSADSSEDESSTNRARSHSNASASASTGKTGRLSMLPSFGSFGRKSGLSVATKSKRKERYGDEGRLPSEPDDSEEEYEERPVLSPRAQYALNGRARSTSTMGSNNQVMQADSPTQSSAVPPPMRRTYTTPASSNVRYVKALYAYAGTKPDELSLRQGMVVAVKSEISGDWWIGEGEGRSGMFPAAYTEPYVPSPTSTTATPPPMPKRTLPPMAGASGGGRTLPPPARTASSLATHHLPPSPSLDLSTSDSELSQGYDDADHYATASLAANPVMESSTPANRSRSSTITGKKAPPPPPPMSRRSQSSQNILGQASLAPPLPAVGRNRSNTGNAIRNFSLESSPEGSPFMGDEDEEYAERAGAGGGTIVDCAECGCADFTQNVFKGKGMCSTCYHQH
ncbi:uncharacterized protein MKK02DRAFT_21407 [Dioszegia hungarica]|uniref:BAR-domain-containing protein n=1 Tax=Dioszegia hungarica TaxID=4972 RepID=A0AA38LQW4_9TREE|nr:uncharacterized protein MKK02DRAFT_21407 [Dioszegia hungarica]KAI9632053.1 hypothetical protein MKK02DRAFT_21407 [Dioszegia hungarica]